MTQPQKSNVALAAERLRAMIFSGELAPGTDHLETELAAMLDVSRTPIREALVMLDAQGLVEMRPRKGVRICPVSAQDMAEIYDVLTELESRAAADAARAGHSDTDLRPMLDLIEKMGDALAANDRVLWAEADAQFHTELVRLGGNRRMAAIVAMLDDQTRRARLVTLNMRPDPSGSNADHRAVYEAIRAGDAVTAHRVHHQHRRRAKDMLLGLLETHNLRQL